MAEKRIHVWVQRFTDRPALVLQWIDPETGKRKSQSAETSDLDQAEKARTDKEYELNHGLHKEVSRMSWERFREAFEEEYVSSKRKNTRRSFARTLDQFEEICNPRNVRGITTRTVSQFAAGLRKLPGRKCGTTMLGSTIKVRLEFLHTALSWAAGQKMIAEVPAFPNIDVPETDPAPVLPETFERLLMKAKDDTMMHAYLLAGWLAGLRLEEAFELEWEENEDFPWLNLDRNRIILPAKFVKGRRDQWLPLAPELHEAVEALPRPGQKVFRFVDREGRPLLSGGVSQRVRYLAKKAGVRLTMRSLRRGFGCRYAGKVPAQVLQKLMRHANIKTTMRYYATVDDAVEEAVFGPKRNNQCNSEASQPDHNSTSSDANPC